MIGWLEPLSWNNETLCPGRNYFLRLNKVNIQEKNFFLGVTTSDHIWVAISLNFLFVHLLIIATESNFNVFKSIGWDQTNIYSFMKAVEDDVNYVES